MTAALVAGSVLLGAVVGSFLNVVIHRVPLGRPVTRPGSACPSCGRSIAVRDNVPVVSWLALRGRCRSCRAAIPARYPVVEATTAALFGLVAVRFGWSWTTPAVDAFVAGLVALAWIDLERYLLPRRVVLSTAAASSLFLLVATVSGDRWAHLGVAAACAGTAYGLFRLLYRINPRWLGFGDVRLSAVIGLVLGWLGVPYLLVGLLVANAAGIAVAVVLLGTGRMRRDTPLPYGVFLAGGSVVSVLAGSPLTHLLGTYRL